MFRLNILIVLCLLLLSGCKDTDHTMEVSGTVEIDAKAAECLDDLAGALELLFPLAMIGYELRDEPDDLILYCSPMNNCITALDAKLAYEFFTR